MEVKGTDCHVSSLVFLDDCLLIAIFEKNNHFTCQLLQNLIFGLDEHGRAFSLTNIFINKTNVVLQLFQVIFKL